jgi:hypothetical protein
MLSFLTDERHRIRAGIRSDFQRMFIPKMGELERGVSVGCGLAQGFRFARVGLEFLRWHRFESSEPAKSRSHESRLKELFDDFPIIAEMNQPVTHIMVGETVQR